MLELAAPLVAESELNVESIRARLDQGFLDATALMEAFISRGVPQRTAHHRVGAMVAMAKEKQCRLVDLSDADFLSVDASFDFSIRDVLNVEGAVNAYRSYGSSNPEQVASQIAYWTERLNGL